MKAWDDIINKALLGSEKASITSSDLPGRIAEDFDLPEETDKEESFLKIVSLAFQFRQSGVQPFDAETTAQLEAPIEEKKYCPEGANSILKTLLDEELGGLLEVWMEACSAKEQLVRPEVLPSLLELAERKKNLRGMVMRVSGERGKWLCTMNPSWNFVTSDIDHEKIWNEGTTDQRKEVLRTLRKTDPTEGRRLLESAWATEGAAEKLAFVELLKINLSAADLPWLQTLKEKGQKVNAAILELLKLIPSSPIVREYESVLAQCVSIKSGKAMLGLMNTTSIVVNESFEFPESIFKTGIQKLSSDKEISDGRNIIAQLIESVPPAFWVSQMQKTPEEIVDLFKKGTDTAFFLPSIAEAAVDFGDTDWIKAILERANSDVLGTSVVRLISGLKGAERNKYALEYFKEHSAPIIPLVLDNKLEWSTELASTILKFTAREVYQYNKQFYREAVTYIPVSMTDRLDSFTPADEKTKQYWLTYRDEIARLLSLKLQTLQSFNA